ncbi:anion permease [Pueribacillus sp. YX66]|uniref:inorganic phosphate transporter n=1 Tax=Pueribacillus sp. YX66 TaxID=3229242 RepID=UPI00358D5E44
MVTIIAFAIALFFAMNIGASGAAASMGIAYGSGAVKWRKLALLISALGIFVGAAIGGGAVMKTIGSGLIPTSIISIQLTVIILFGATLTLFIANLLGIPLSTSEVTVGSVVGVGIAYNSVFFGSVLNIIIWWIVIPIVAFMLAFLFGKILIWSERTFPMIHQKKVYKWFVILIIVAGFLEAFSAGMNNAANAFGPLVGAGVITIQQGMLLGGLFVALGALFLGGKVIETNGKKITNLSLLEGITISSTSASLVIVASIFGIPIPMTQITTTGILGMGASKVGVSIFKRNIIKKIVTVWLVSPMFSLAISYGFVKLFLDDDVYTLVAIVSVLFATIGTMVLMKLTKRERERILNDGK